MLLHSCWKSWRLECMRLLWLHQVITSCKLSTWRETCIYPRTWNNSHPKKKMTSIRDSQKVTTNSKTNLNSNNSSKQSPAIVKCWSSSTSPTIRFTFSRALSSRPSTWCSSPSWDLCWVSSSSSPATSWCFLSLAPSPSTPKEKESLPLPPPPSRSWPWMSRPQSKWFRIFRHILFTCALLLSCSIYYCDGIMGSKELIRIITRLFSLWLFRFYSWYQSDRMMELEHITLTSKAGSWLYFIQIRWSW